MEMVELTPVSPTRSLLGIALGTRPYYFISGLLYPAVLGAALIWFVQGVAAYFTGSASRPSAWGLFFALWFVIYHSLLYARLIDVHSEWVSAPAPHSGDAYNIASLSSDILDSIALFLAFWALDFLERPITPNRTGWLFVAAFLVPASSLLAHKVRVSGLRLVLVVLAFILTAAGAVLNFLPPPAVSSTWNDHLLGSLWVLLVIYFVGLYRRAA